MNPTPFPGKINPGSLLNFRKRQLHRRYQPANRRVSTTFICLLLNQKGNCGFVKPVSISA